MQRARYRILVVVSLALSVTVLAILAKGTYDLFSFEPTDTALAAARTGVVLVKVGAVLAVVDGLFGVAFLRARWSSVALVVAPALLVAGCLAVAERTLLPQLTLLVGAPFLLAGAILMVVPSRRLAPSQRPYTVS